MRSTRNGPAHGAFCSVGVTGYRLDSMPENRVSMLFLSQLRGQNLQGTQVVFPGVISFVLDLTPPRWKRWFGSAKTPES
jgi:hypothetical protein